MGAFTMTLKRAIELTGGTIEFLNGQTLLDPGNIGLAYYPIFDETYRAGLNGKIVDHYMNREIGMETIDMFQLAMRRKMNEIMPAYNALYLSTQIVYDPLKTIDISTVNTNDTTQNATISGTNSGTANSTNKARAVSSDTPQTMLSPDSDYASAATDSNSTGDTTTTGTEASTNDVTATGNSTNTVSGYQAIPADLILRYREAIVNVDLMIINELDECFMQVWDNGDEYSNPYERLYY